MSQHQLDAAIQHQIHIAEIRGVATSLCLALVMIICYDYGMHGGDGFATTVVCSVLCFVLFLVRQIGL